MKKLFVSIALVLIAFLPFNASAQVSLNINIGSQPLWGPTGYDHVDYYYLPDIESYYYVPTREFIYLNNGGWVFTSSLPARYSNYNLYNGYKVVINSPKPYLNFKTQKVKYAKYKGNHGQAVISRSTNPKYFVIKGHPKHGVKINNGQGSSGKYKAQGGGSKGNSGAKGKGGPKGNGGGNSKGKGKH